MASVRNYKVGVMGASGGIGQPLSLLLKLDNNVSYILPYCAKSCLYSFYFLFDFFLKVTELSLFDVVRTPGVAADISHCCSPAKCVGYEGMDNISKALTGMKLTK